MQSKWHVNDDYFNLKRLIRAIGQSLKYRVQCRYIYRAVPNHNSIRTAKSIIWINL